jgi:geranylgeranyl pyrophosphate synthase
MLCEHGVPGECRRALDLYLDGAREQLQSLPDSESRAALMQLADYLGYLAGAIRAAD